MRSKVLAVLASTTAAALIAGGAFAQDNPLTSANPLGLPENVTVFGSRMPDVIKATAIVNGEVITQTDINQRLAFLLIASDAQPSAEELERLRQQVFSNLIDETLQIQAAKSAEIEITEAEIDRTVERVAANVKQTPDQMAEYLKARGASIRTVRRQIHGEIAWRRIQGQKIESRSSVGEDEVKAVLERLEASKGSQQYRVGEIYIPATAATMDQARANAAQIIDGIRQGGSFVAYARQFSQASTAAVGGDLGWVRPEQLPEPIAAVMRQMAPGQISAPIPVPGGISIIAVQDVRKVLTADPRDAVLTMKQVSIKFPAGTSRQVAEPVVARFAQASRSIGGCGGAEKLAADFKAEVVEADNVKLRELPPVLQQMITAMQIGQATQPIGSLEDGVRVLVLCGRDVADPTMPTYDQIFAQLNEERVNLRARRYLRDLRRDAVIDFR
ncbi:peptidylprolyl isomerase [Sphingomonas mesophila]|uniref:peptidylprolyl isomerase n=1 Tax=Sphingomonas mesophila TaxID=2303576 RepID=UPI000E586203|nr:peptidylprolyl isomerase [Sphingomonas mesophila]